MSTSVTFDRYEITKFRGSDFTNSTKHSLSIVKSCFDTQEISPPFKETKGMLSRLKESSNDPYHKPGKSSPHLPTQI